MITEEITYKGGEISTIFNGEDSDIKKIEIEIDSDGKVYFKDATENNKIILSLGRSEFIRFKSLMNDLEGKYLEIQSILGAS